MVAHLLRKNSYRFDFVLFDDSGLAQPIHKIQHTGSLQDRHPFLFGGLDKNIGPEQGLLYFLFTVTPLLHGGNGGAVAAKAVLFEGFRYFLLGPRTGV